MSLLIQNLRRTLISRRALSASSGPRAPKCTTTGRLFHAQRISCAANTSAAPPPNDETSFEDDGELFSPDAEKTRSPSLPPSPAKPGGELRTRRFEESFGFLSTHIGRKPSAEDSLQARSSTWLYLFDLATQPEQLKRVSSKFSQFVDGGRVFPEGHALAFTRRCAELRCPQLALAVFSDRPTYRLDLTPAAARHLMYALHEQRPLSDVIALATLYRLYKLPPLSADPVSCALLISACLREATASGSEPASTIATALLPGFKDLLSRTELMPTPQSATENNSLKERLWMERAALNILEVLSSRGDDTKWIEDWCTRNGYTPSEGAP
ncbi:hypothetical protein BC834DRAFT_963960 [Gloeopeniophorella convolvens]|nr:hypothetical protein BC834DRAFT_963960 [Gloeopeniophorella convolvens]